MLAICFACYEPDKFVYASVSAWVHRLPSCHATFFNSFFLGSWSTSPQWRRFFKRGKGRTTYHCRNKRKMFFFKQAYPCFPALVTRRHLLWSVIFIQGKRRKSNTVTATTKTAKAKCLNTWKTAHHQNAKWGKESIEAGFQETGSVVEPPDKYAFLCFSFPSYHTPRHSHFLFGLILNELIYLLRMSVHEEKRK